MLSSSLGYGPIAGFLKHGKESLNYKGGEFRNHVATISFSNLSSHKITELMFKYIVWLLFTSC